MARALSAEPQRFIGRDPVGVTMLTLAEAAAQLDVPADRVRKWLQSGELGGTKVSRQWRVPAVAELERRGRLRGRSRRLDPCYRAEH